MNDSQPTAQQPHQVGGGRRAVGDLAPKFAALTDDVLFDDVWNRPELAARDRSLSTVAALVAGGDTQQLRFHLPRARGNGVRDNELIEAVTHLAFYTGWPKATTATNVLKGRHRRVTEQRLPRAPRRLA